MSVNKRLSVFIDYLYGEHHTSGQGSNGITTRSDDLNKPNEVSELAMFPSASPRYLTAYPDYQR